MQELHSKVIAICCLLVLVGAAAGPTRKLNRSDAAVLRSRFVEAFGKDFDPGQSRIHHAVEGKWWRDVLAGLRETKTRRLYPTYDVTSWLWDYLPR